MANGFTAACFSTMGLVRLLGTTLPELTSEVATGIMVIKDLDEWVNRTKAKFPGGPRTFPLRQRTNIGSESERVMHPLDAEWWHIWNYLSYGAGAVVIGGTGSVWGLTMDQVLDNPLDSYTEPFDVIFSTGYDFDAFQTAGMNSSQTGGDANILVCKTALKRDNVFGIVGMSLRGNPQYQYKTGDTAGWDTAPGNFNTSTGAFGSWINGFTYTHMQGFGLFADAARGTYTNKKGITQSNIIAVANRKFFIKNWVNPGFDYSEIDQMHLASDYAGALGRAVRDNYPWSTPAGFNRGRILNIIKTAIALTPDQELNMEKEGLQVVPKNVPGKGFYFLSNVTQGAPTSALNKADLKSVINYVKKTIKDASLNYLFEVNNPTTRLSFTNYATNILNGIKDSGAIGGFTVQCDAINNTDPTKLVARIIIQTVDTIKTIDLQVSISPDGAQIIESFTI